MAIPPLSLFAIARPPALQNAIEQNGSMTDNTKPDVALHNDWHNECVSALREIKANDHCDYSALA
jgi:hypothetical protein